MLEKKTILYIDDEAINLKIFQLSFKNTFEITVTNRPLTALKILKDKPDFDLVLIDMSMPDMSGIEFVEIAAKKYNYPKYAMLTGYIDLPEISDALDRNLILKCFSKPFKRDKIQEDIEELFTTSKT
ncbi:MAG: response regulator [Salibacteraceae bacterium]